MEQDEQTVWEATLETGTDVSSYATGSERAGLW